MTDNIPRYPRLLVLSSAFLFSLAAPVSKVVDIGPLGIAFFRSVVGIVALILMTYRHSDLRIRNIRMSTVLGGLSYAGTSLSFFIALKYTSAANATILFQTSPLFLMPLGYLFLREKTDHWDILSMTLIFAGILLCFAGDISTSGIWGNLAALTGALMFSFMTILMRKTDFAGKTLMILVGNLVIIIVTLPFIFRIRLDAFGVTMASLLGIVHMALPFVLFNRGLGSLRAVEASMFKNLETVLAPLWVALLVREIPGTYTITGFFCVVIALTLRARMHSKSQKTGINSQGDLI